MESMIQKTMWLNMVWLMVTIWFMRQIIIRENYMVRVSMIMIQLWILMILFLLMWSQIEKSPVFIIKMRMRRQIGFGGGGGNLINVIPLGMMVIFQAHLRQTVTMVSIVSNQFFWCFKDFFLWFLELLLAISMSTKLSSFSNISHSG